MIVTAGGNHIFSYSCGVASKKLSDFEKGKMNTTNYLMASKPRWENGDPVTLDGQAQYGAGKVFRAGVDALYNIDMEQIKEIQALAEDGLESIQNAQVNVLRRYDNGGPNTNDIIHCFAVYTVA